MVLDSEERDIAEEAYWYLWRLWGARNTMSFKGIETDPILMKNQLGALGDYTLQVSRADDELIRPPADATHWSRPESGTIKVNTDASVNAAGGVRISFVARDHNGGLVLAGARACLGKWSVLEAEGEAMRWAMIQLQSMGATKLWLESDCLSLVSKLDQNDFGRGTLSTILRDIVSRKLHFQQCMWTFVRRENNKVAHELCLFPFGFTFISDNWMEIPPHIVDILSNECTA